MATPDEKDENKPDEEVFTRDLDTHFPLSGNEAEDNLEDEEDTDTVDEDAAEDEEFKENLETEFPLSGGETDAK